MHLLKTLFTSSHFFFFDTVKALSNTFPFSHTLFRAFSSCILVMKSGQKTVTSVPLSDICFHRHKPVGIQSCGRIEKWRNTVTQKNKSDLVDKSVSMIQFCQHLCCKTSLEVNANCGLWAWTLVHIYLRMQKQVEQIWQSYTAEAIFLHALHKDI